VGVGAARAEELKRHVLDIPEPEERAVLDETAGLAADAVVCWVRDGLVAAMNRFNRKERKEVSEP
jgi:peptidyl-tRNA hydrolase